MVKRRSPHRIAALLLCILLCMGLSMYLSCRAFAFSDEDSTGVSASGIVVDIAQPPACTADSAEVGYCITDTAGNGFASAKVKVGTDGEWQDVTDSLEKWDDLYTGHVRITDNCAVTVRVTGHDSAVYEKTRYINCFTNGSQIFLTGDMQNQDGNTEGAESESSASVADNKDSEPDTVTRSPLALTPDGQGTVVDDVAETGSKEFFTISTKDDSTFYLVIDRERENENVYLLDTVKESDLMSLAEKDTVSQSAIPDPDPVCGCADKCVPGDVRTNCPVCVLSWKDCAGKAPAVDPSQESAAPKDDNTSIIILVLIAVLAVGGAGYYLKIYKPKHDLDDAEDFDDLTGEDEETINEDDMEPTPRHISRAEPEEPDYPEGYGYEEPGDDE
ncbi:MAG: DUF4366 domain-containing protein [Oscillospiraceae bacterium]|nr:DUF4366 domain-containing protein [Oscillospiraceae bacterium]